MKKRSTIFYKQVKTPSHFPLAVRGGSRLFFVIALSLMLWFFGLGRGNAQTSQASVRGLVRDSGNALIPGAKLALTNVDTHVVSNSVSGDGGEYLFVNVTPGTYTLEAEKPGFQPQRLKPFVLAVNQTTTLDFGLTVGSVDQVVEVEAVGSGIQASTSELGLTLAAKQIEDIPLNTRNFTSLLITTPGVSPTVVSGSQTTSYTTSIGPAIIPSFNGQTNRSNLFVVDGVLNYETFGNAYAVQPIIDGMQDMKMQSHNDSAEFGGTTGGTINIASKSGTNALHGSAWEFNKTPELQAVPFFSTSVAPIRQNQYGFTLGGPIALPKLYNGRNRTFFFGAYEGFRLNQPSTSYILAPTAAQLGGDFTANAPIYDPATTTCTSAGVCTRKQFSYRGVLNVIDPARLNQGAIYYARNAIAQADTTGAAIPAGSNAFQSAPNVQDLYQYQARIDETLTSKDSIFVRVMGIRGSQTSGRSQLPQSKVTNGYTTAGSYVHIFGPNSVLHLQGGQVYERIGLIQRFNGTPADLGTKTGFPTALGAGFSNLPNAVPGISVDNHFGDLGDYSNPTESAKGWSIKGDYTQVVGRHTLKFGAEFNKIGESQAIQWAQEGFRAQETNSLQDGQNGNAGSTGDAAASLVLGIPGGFTKRNVDETVSFGGLLGIYVQDQFQATPNLTINAGIRYDVAYIPKYGTDGNSNQYVGNFDFNNGTYVVYKVPGSCAKLGTAPCIPTADGSLPAHVVASPDGKVLQNQYDNFQPRLGAAYRVNATTALRGGIGLAFDNLAGLVQNIRGVSGNWPSVSQVSQTTFNNATTANPTPQYNIANLPALSALPAATPFNQFNWFIDPNHKDAYSVQYNFGVQHQLDSHTVLSAAYVGSFNRRLDVGSYYNVASTPGPGDPAARRPYPYITPTYWSRSVGSGNYNSLQMQLVRNVSRGLSATVAYTWSKSIDIACSGFFGSEGCSVQQIYNLSAERSVSAFDVPHSFVATANYQLPIGRGKMLDLHNGFANAVVGSWQLNGFARLYSGRPFTVTMATDNANIGITGYLRPNLTGNWKGTQSANAAALSRTSWLNSAAFSVPTLYTFGNEGRNTLRAPAFRGLDLSLFKEVPIYREAHARFAIEAFNALNHPIFGTPGGTYGSASFGRFSSTASTERQIQLSAKFMF